LLHGWTVQRLDDDAQPAWPAEHVSVGGRLGDAGAWTARVPIANAHPRRSLLRSLPLPRSPAGRDSHQAVEAGRTGAEDVERAAAGFALRLGTCQALSAGVSVNLAGRTGSDDIIQLVLADVGAVTLGQIGRLSGVDVQALGVSSSAIQRRYSR